jgi:hypothetical protein
MSLMEMLLKMASFDETNAAVECARAIQQTVDAFNIASREELPVRIGLDVGEHSASCRLFVSPAQWLELIDVGLHLQGPATGCSGRLSP